MLSCIYFIPSRSVIGMTTPKIEFAERGMRRPLSKSPSTSNLTSIYAGTSGWNDFLPYPLILQFTHPLNAGF